MQRRHLGHVITAKTEIRTHRCEQELQTCLIATSHSIMDGSVSLVVTQSGVCLVLQEVFHAPECTTAILPKFVEIEQTSQHIMERQNLGFAP